MKVYDLRCEHDHRFEGWFSSEDDFVSQSERKLIDCPFCNNQSITRLPSSPRLNLSHIERSIVQRTDEAQQRLQEAYLQVAREIMSNTEDVGDGFAEEARRIHYKETAERGIRGVTTQEERAELAEEGIDVFSLPLPTTTKQTLQ